MHKPRLISTLSTIVIAFGIFSILASGIFLTVFSVAQEFFYSGLEVEGGSYLSTIDELILRNIFGYSWIILGLSMLLLFGGLSLAKRKPWARMLLQGAAVLAIISTAIPFGFMVFRSISATLALLALVVWIIVVLPFATLIFFINRPVVKEWLKNTPASDVDVILPKQSVTSDYD